MTTLDISAPTADHMLKYAKPEPEQISREDLLNIHRQLVSTIKQVNRAMGREVKVVVIRPD